MPRKPRIDAPGLLYHVIARGIDGRELFTDAKDGEFFVERLGDVLLKTRTPIYTFALISNHFHLLLKRGETEIATVMRKLLTGYAVYYNRRHKRCGHLFQNRYKAIVCQDDRYFLELIRYINLNPIRAGLVSSVDQLNNYPFCAHKYLLGKAKCEFMKPDAVLSHFGPGAGKARGAYIEFLTDGLSMGRRPDLVGGGLKRSLGYPKNYPKIKWAFDDRILGEGSFVESVIALTDQSKMQNDVRPEIEDLLASVCEDCKVSSSSVLGKSRVRPISNARAYLAYRMATQTGLSPSEIAQFLSISVPGALKAINRGRAIAENAQG